MPESKPGAKRNRFEEDAMTSPAAEANKQKCPSCGQSIMTSPVVEANKHKCPSCGADVMAAPKTE